MAGKYLKFLLAVLGVFLGGILLLALAGRFFIRELSEKAILEERGGEAPQLGELAPGFELEDLSGKKVLLSDFLGSGLIVTFWASWNPLAQDQVSILDEYLAKNNKGLFKIITIASQEDRSKAASFLERGGYKLETLLDESGEVSTRYQIRTLPATYFIDRSGRIREIFVGVLGAEALELLSEKLVE